MTHNSSPPSLKQALQDSCQINLFPFSRTFINKEEIDGNESQPTHCPVTALSLPVPNQFCAGATDPTPPAATSQHPFTGTLI